MSAIVNRGHAALDRLSRAFGIAKGERQELFAEALEELADRAADFIAPPPDGKASDHGDKTQRPEPRADAQTTKVNSARQTQTQIASPSPSQDDGDPDGAPAFHPLEPAPVKSIKEEQGSAADVIAAARARISVAGQRP